MVKGSNPVFVREKDRNRLVENMVRIMLLDPKVSRAPVAVKDGPYEGQTSVFFLWKDSREISDRLLGFFADNIGAYWVTKYVKNSMIHFCIEWS